jgi:hypothetical protein
VLNREQFRRKLPSPIPGHLSCKVSARLSRCNNNDIFSKAHCSIAFHTIPCSLNTKNWDFPMTKTQFLMSDKLHTSGVVTTQLASAPVFCRNCTKLMCFVTVPAVYPQSSSPIHLYLPSSPLPSKLLNQGILPWTSPHDCLVGVLQQKRKYS